MITNAGEDTGEKEPCHIVGKNETYTNTMEINMNIPQKVNFNFYYFTLHVC